MLLEAEIVTAQGLLGMLGMGLTVPQEGSEPQAGGCGAQQDPAPLGQQVGHGRTPPKPRSQTWGVQKQAARP